jgi:citrate synthase
LPLRPSVDVQIATAITELGEGDVRYRGYSVPELSRRAGFEEAAELLWFGSLAEGPLRWPAPAAADVRVARAAVSALGPAAAALTRLMAMVTALASHDPFRGDRSPHAIAATGRRMIGAMTRAAHPQRRRVGARVAEHVAAAWVRSPNPALTAAIDRALVLLADHELATSTLAVRVAASTWADPYAAVLAGLAAMSGPLHGAAGAEVVSLLRRCEADGVATAVGSLLHQGGRVPGFGHKVYRGEDPRVAPLLEEVRRLGRGSSRLAVVEELLRVTAVRLTRQANVDVALGALAFVAEPLADDVPDVGLLFGVARIAGWLAHASEEYSEAPVRFRAVGRYVGPTHPT